MTQQKDKFDEFLEEVENDIRQEKYMQLWQKYGKLASSVVTTGIIILCVYTLWSTYQDKQQLKNADYYITAQQHIAQGQFSKALSILKAIEPGGMFSSSQAKTYPHLARFTQAALLQEPGDQHNINQAIALYDELSQDRSFDPVWQSIATLQSVRLQFQQTPEKATELLTKIEPLTQDGQAFQALALEQKGLMLQHVGKTTDAAEVFVKLVQMKEAPEGVSMRAQIMVQQLGTSSK